MKPKVLVTGATGFIGRAVSSTLERADWDVIRGSRFEREGHVRVDLKDPAFAAQLLEGPRIDAIVHLAAKVELKDKTLDQLFVPNVLGTGNLLAVAKRWQAHFVFASTVVVCGATNRHVTSKSPPNPDMPYAESKWLAEQLISASGVPATILRLSGVFGANGPDHLGLNRAIMGATRGQIPKLAGDGSARRNYAYVKDVALDVAYALKNGVQGTHLISGSETTSIGQMLDSVCQVFLPGVSPEKTEGATTQDQVIERSPLLPATRAFSDALRDIKEALQ
jgi:nucleoside-diphosphate-sugar epimerase